MTGRVGPGARALGYAGLLPQVAAVAAVASGADAGIGALVALAYAALILSFLGGTWWGFAMRREAGQAGLAALAVVPSLFAFGVILGHPLIGSIGAALILLALGLVATLAVDRWLERRGEAPAGWLGVRVSLSLGLGALTALAGLL